MVSSSNENMLNRNSLASFIIQHIGSSSDPLHGWGLNCRTRDVMYDLLEKAGFKQVRLYNDAEYAGKEDSLSEEILNRVDTLPSEVMGYEISTVPLALPSPEEQNIGYNHIAVAVKR